jgi:hypothetical protein
MIEFDGSRDFPKEAEGFLHVLSCVAPIKGAAYAAVPITTGSRFLKWYVEGGAFIEGSNRYAEDHRHSVVEPNCSDARVRIAAIRKALPLPVIDPSAFEWPTWSQEEYRAFWAAVIRRYAAMAVFFDGWQFSSGCSFEFLTATTADIPTLGEHLQPLSRMKGYELIVAAVSEFRRHGIPAPVLESVLRNLEAKHGCGA